MFLLQKHAQSEHCRKDKPNYTDNQKTVETRTAASISSIFLTEVLKSCFLNNLFNKYIVHFLPPNPFTKVYSMEKKRQHYPYLRIRDSELFILIGFELIYVRFVIIYSGICHIKWR